MGNASSMGIGPCAISPSFDHFDDERGHARRILRSRECARCRMVQRGEHLRFAAEASETLGVGRQRLRQDLIATVAPEPRVARPEDFAHPARAEQARPDVVGAEACGPGARANSGIIRAGWQGRHSSWLGPTANRRVKKKSNLHRTPRIRGTQMQNRPPRVGRTRAFERDRHAAVAATLTHRARRRRRRPDTTLVDVPLGPSATITVERLGDIVLVGLNRPFIQKPARSIPRARGSPSLLSIRARPERCARSCSLAWRTISRAASTSMRRRAGIIADSVPRARRRRSTSSANGQRAGRSRRRRGPPATRGIWHEIYLAGDVRVAAANTRFDRDENTHGRFPGGGATVALRREAAGARDAYMLTAITGGEESYRMGPHHAADLSRRRQRRSRPASRSRANRACAPLGVKATLASAHQNDRPGGKADALSKLGAHNSTLYRTEYLSKAAALKPEGRPPQYRESDDHADSDKRP